MLRNTPDNTVEDLFELACFSSSNSLLILERSDLNSATFSLLLRCCFSGLQKIGRAHV